MSTVLDWAKAAGFRNGENPVTGVGKGLPKQTERVTHHAAMPFAQVPAFIQRLHQSDANELTRLALEFLILTAARTGEMIGAKRSEFDLQQAVWIVPAERMKAQREHRVPLSSRCVEILHQIESLGSQSEYIFPGRSPDKPASNMVFAMLLRRLEVPFTVHGFRSSFRDWAAECTTAPREVAEMCLAHTITNKVEAAYRRGDLFEKRLKLMSEWMLFVNESRGASHFEEMR